MPITLAEAKVGMADKVDQMIVDEFRRSSLLLDRLKGGHSGIVRMELEGRLMIRNSCSSVEDSMWSDYCI